MLQELLGCFLIGLVWSDSFVHVELGELLSGVVVQDVGLDMLRHLRFFQRVESQLLSLVCSPNLIVVYKVC